MIKKLIRDTLQSALDVRSDCRLSFRCVDDVYCFPLRISERLLLAAYNDDFQINGFSVYPLKSILEASLDDGMYSDICRREGILDDIVVPELDLTDVRSAVSSVATLCDIFIVETFIKGDDALNFYIGRVEKLCSSYFYFRHFSPYGEWDEAPLCIYYSEVAHMNFGDRYSLTFAKYLPPPPAAK